jgi:hypothetical protein
LCGNVPVVLPADDFTVDSRGYPIGTLLKRCRGIGSCVDGAGSQKG